MAQAKEWKKKKRSQQHHLFVHFSSTNQTALIKFKCKTKTMCLLKTIARQESRNKKEKKKWIERLILRGRLLRWIPFRCWIPKLPIDRLWPPNNASLGHFMCRLELDSFFLFFFFVIAVVVYWRQWRDGHLGGFVSDGSSRLKAVWHAHKYAIYLEIRKIIIVFNAVLSLPRC